MMPRGARPVPGGCGKGQIGCGRRRIRILVPSDVDAAFIFCLNELSVHLWLRKGTPMTSAPSTTRRVALVTGGSGGIGRAVVERLAADGFAVAVHYAGNKDGAEALVEEITAAGGRAVAVSGDVADEQAMEAAFDAVEATFGGIDVVVNTAGIMAPTSAAPSSSPSRPPAGCATAARSSTSPPPSPAPSCPPTAATSRARPPSRASR
jgi:NADPH:quinone reductase-like Zn-dependent oxidoreductase